VFDGWMDMDEYVRVPSHYCALAGVIGVLSFGVGWIFFFSFVRLETPRLFYVIYAGFSVGASRFHACTYIARVFFVFSVFFL
jgi:hypothetical protein